MEPRCSPDGSYVLVLFCSGGFGGAKTLLGRLWGAKMVQHGAKMEPRWAMMVQHGTKMKPRWGQQASAVSLSVFALSFEEDKTKRNIYIYIYIYIYICIYIQTPDQPLSAAPYYIIYMYMSIYIYIHDIYNINIS